MICFNRINNSPHLCKVRKLSRQTVNCIHHSISIKIAEAWAGWWLGMTPRIIHWNSSVTIPDFHHPPDLGSNISIVLLLSPTTRAGAGRGGAARGGNQQQLAMNSNWISRRRWWRLPACPPCIPVIAGEQRWWPGTALTITPPRHVGHVGR